MKNVFLTVIRRGGYDLTGMLKRIDEYHIAGKLSDADHAELIAAARNDATPGVDAASEVQLLWSAVHDLTQRVAALEGGAAGGDGAAAEYVQPTGAHDAYYRGAIVAYTGKVYKCVAPDGVACVWPPDVLPSYWEEV